MPFGRSHARSKSRSPAPDSSFFPATPNSKYSRPPTFLPPSHYATAAGLTSAKSIPTDGPREPISSPRSSTEGTDARDSPFGTVGKLMGRSPHGRTSGTRSTASPIASETVATRDPRERRMSQLGDIPLLETQLLPSLRDTVDRMTQSPQPKSDHSDHTDAQSVSSSQSGSSRRRREDVGVSPSVMSIPPPTPSSMRGTPDPCVTSAIPRLNPMRSPAPKSALKSPARRNIFTPSMPSSRSPQPEDVTSRPDYGVHSGSESSLEMRSPRDRSRPNEVSLSSTSKPSLKTVSSLPRLKPESKSRSNPATPQPTQRSATLATPQPSRSPASPLPQSSLPLPKLNRRDRPLPSDSGSELERRVSLSHSPGRLVVTNAVIVPSSSESDRSVKGRNRRSQWFSPAEARTLPPSPNLPRSSPRESPRVRFQKEASASAAGRHARRNTAVGLGLKVQEFNSGKREADPSLSDDESLYDDRLSEHSLLTDEPLFYEDDDGSIYDDEPPRAPSRSSRQSDGVHDKRRQEALMGLVDGLQRDYGRSSPSGAKPSFTRRESDVDCSSQGLAIGGSADLQDARTSAGQRKSPVPHHNKYSSASESDAESMYSDEDVDNARLRRTQAHRGTQNRTESPHQPKNSKDNEEQNMRSLRHSHTSWKRPSTSLGVRESERAEKQDRSTHLDTGDRRRSVSPMSASASPRSRSPMPSRTTSPLPQHGPPSPQHGSRSRNTASGRSSGNNERKRSRAMSMSVREDGHGARESTASASRGSRVLAEAWDAGLRRPEDSGARERLAFGIPDSLSYNGNNAAPEEDHSVRMPLERIESAWSSRPQLPRVDSDISIADSAWEDQVRFSKELSHGAAALFETLTSKAKGTMGGRSPVYHDASYDYEQDRTPVAEPSAWIPRDTAPTSRSRNRSRSASRSPAMQPIAAPETGRARRRSLDTTSMSSVSSPESVYDEPASPVERVATPPPPPPPPPPKSRHQANPELSGTWRSTLSPDVYESLSKRYGPTEMARQELIYSLYDSEKTFIKSSRHVVRTYFVPLRARDSRAWLLGLPPDVARLFDWLEDIVNLHVAIARALSGVVSAWKTGAVVARVAGTLRAFVPQLEIYMPYLVKLESVRDTIRWHAEKDGGELGEYLRMKERERVEGEWALEKLFEEAAVRLHHYLEVFQKLCEVTSSDHNDHLAAVSLLCATRMSVKVMEEVKAREDEYDFVKDLASRIDGLCDATPLARRARRLLWYGTLLQPDNKSSSSAPKTPARMHVDPPVAEPRTPAAKGNSLRRPAQRMSKLVTAVRDWDARRHRSGSISSFASSIVSVPTSDSLSSASSGSILVTPKSDHFPMVGGSRGRSGSVSKGAFKAAADNARAHGHRQDIEPEGPQGRMLNAMVFSDLIVLASPTTDEDASRGDSTDEQRCRLLPGSGLSRILDIYEGSDGAVTLNLISISPGHLDTGFIGEDTRVVSVTLALPAPEGGDDEGAARQELYSALRKCRQHTVRSLSFPSLPGAMMEDGEIDTRQSLVGILSSGLPLPKSPSIQIDEASKGQRRDAIDGEREERGWWTLRFQQVLRELQRE